MSRRLSLPALVGAGVRAVAEQRGLVLRLFGVQVLASLTFAVGIGLALQRTLGGRPLFDRAIGGDDAALLSLVLTQADLFTGLFWAGAGWLLGYALLSLYLTAGLLGAFARRPFAEAAGARFGAFVRLALLALLPWAVGLVACSAGLRLGGLEMEDTLAADRLLGRTLLALAPGLALLLLVSCAVDQARARLAVDARAGALRALLGGFGRTFTRAALLPHLLLYTVLWLCVSLIYFGLTAGVPFAGAAGALSLFALREVVAALRFLLRAVASGGQVAALQVEVLEVRELVERPEARGDVAQGEVAQPVQGEVLDRE